MNISALFVDLLTLASFPINRQTLIWKNIKDEKALKIIDTIIDSFQVYLHELDDLVILCKDHLQSLTTRF